MKKLFESDGGGFDGGGFDGGGFDGFDGGGTDGSDGGGFYGPFFSRRQPGGGPGCFESAVKIALFVLLLFGVAFMLQWC